MPQAAVYSWPWERGLHILAMLTTVNYVGSFLFEVGFFWRMGPGAMTAFSFSEHVVHAAMVIVTLTGMFGILATIAALQMTTFSVLGKFIVPRLTKSTVMRVVISSGLAAPIIMIGGAIGLHGKVTFNPAVAISILGVVSYLAYAASESWKWPNVIWMIPASLTALTLPAALGYSQFLLTLRNADRSPIALIAGRRSIDGGLIFVGSEKVILQTKKGLLLVSLDGSFIGKHPVKAAATVSRLPV